MMDNLTDHDLILRIDERTATMHKNIEDLNKCVVTQKEFKPVRAIVYGTVGLVGTAVIGALLTSVIR